MAKLIRILVRRIQRLLKVQSESRQPQKPTTQTRTIKVLLLLLFAILLVVMYPGEDLFDPFDIPRRGEISLQDILAPFEITIFKSEQDLSEDRARERQSVPYVLNADTSVVAEATQRLEAFLTLADSIRAELPVDMSPSQAPVELISDRFPLMSQSAIEKSLRQPIDLDRVEEQLRQIYTNEIYRLGVLPNGATLPEGGSRSVVIRKGEQELSFQRDQLYDRATANLRLLTALNRLADRDTIDVDYYYNVGKNFIRPNLAIDREEYNARVDKALESISPVKKIVEEGDIIVRAGQRVTTDQEEVLVEMARIQRQQAAEEGWFMAALPFIGRIFLSLAAFMALYLFLYNFRRTVYNSNPKILAMFLVFVLQFGLIYLVGGMAERIGISSIYIYPVAVLPVMITVLFDPEIGILSTIILALLLGVMHRFSFTISLMTVVVGLVACFSAGRVYKRSDFYRIMLAVILSYVLLILVVETLKLTPNPEIMPELALGALNGIITIVLAIFFLPIFESLFGFTTDLTLLELSDLNHPLLKRLALEAPGTYHHSIVVGNLCESAAKAITANHLLARVGAYYHDIGKMEIPEYFVENQLSVKSRHEVLTPSMSSLILSAHVKKGRWLGEEAGLPNEVLNFIEEHHGTMVMSYFYDKALKQGADPADIDKYRYPGPKPQTRETGISMLADAVEAASRTLDEPKPARINNLIQRIINDRFQSGQLDECPLTLRDLARIKEAFAKVVMAAFHQRIVYPSKDEK
ncbi:HDIG domain-containing protein [candidate division GN15 bacterium]|nr:HDIG domain-containing protein [candidate division GN15 bacterium]